MSVSVRPVRSSVDARLGPVELITGGLLLIAVALGMIGPLIAALLIRRSGAGRTDAMASVPLILLTLAVILATTAGLTMFAIAHRRSSDAGRAAGAPVETGGR
ncbi:hypothetical protein ACWZHB_32005 [Nocardia sp. FBN12]|uniref:hypothetical protein n=1 Tax=Nocardia sp. FBN12 TaxID=3419766 RepID=UPI003CFFDFAB